MTLPLLTHTYHAPFPSPPIPSHALPLCVSCATHTQTHTLSNALPSSSVHLSTLSTLLYDKCFLPLPPCSRFLERTAACEKHRQGLRQVCSQARVTEKIPVAVWRNKALTIWRLWGGKQGLGSNSDIQGTLKNKSNLCSEAISHARTEFQVNSLPHIGATHDTGVCVCL